VPPVDRLGWILPLLSLPRLFGRRRPPAPPPTSWAPAPDASAAAAAPATCWSILDCGAGAVKALVAAPRTGEPGRSVVLAAAAEPWMAEAPPHAPGAFDLLVAASERALVAAEDAAGVVPRRAVVAVPAARSVVAAGQAKVRRRRAVAPVAAGELAPLVGRARRAAAAAAQRRRAAESGVSEPLELVNESLTERSVDGRAAANPVGLAGEQLSVTLVGAFAPAADIRRLRQLAEALDLELAGLLCVPFALGAALGRGPEAPALVIDVGAATTTAALAGPAGVEAAATFPLGGRALEGNLRAALGMDDQSAREAIAAHCAGAEAHSGARAAGRAVRRLAQHHAEVWLDALELVCADLARGRPLPPKLMLCGGAARLPELRLGLAASAWRATLPFARPPAVRLLGPANVPGVEDASAALPAMQAVPPLCLASAAAALVAA
jgi:hypothetical protein